MRYTAGFRSSEESCDTYYQGEVNCHDEVWLYEEPPVKVWIRRVGGTYRVHATQLALGIVPVETELLFDGMHGLCCFDEMCQERPLEGFDPENPDSVTWERLIAWRAEQVL